MSSDEPATLRDHIAIPDHAVQQDRPEFVRTRAAALEACGFAECSPACARILTACLSGFKDLTGYEKLKDKHTRLLAHCNELEDRLQLYATVINTLASQNAALAGRDAGTARVVALPRPENSPDGGLCQVPAGTRHHSRRTAPGGPRQSPMARKPGQADGSPRASAHLP